MSLTCRRRSSFLRVGLREFGLPAIGFPAVGLVALFLLVGCRGAMFHERKYLSDPLMRLEADPTSIHFHQKVYYSREGSVGGIGAGAGGGCGCY